MIDFGPDARCLDLPVQPASAVGGRRSADSVALGMLRAMVAISVLFVAAPSLLAEHARIDLRVSSQQKEVRASADEDPPPGGLNEPPVIHVAVNQPLVLQFILTNAYPHGMLKNVTVRYYIVPATKLGRKPAPSFRKSSGSDEASRPLLDDGFVEQGEFTMNFKPECRVGTRLKFQIAQPGIYSVRVETVNTQSDHEHFSAIDVVAK